MIRAARTWIAAVLLALAPAVAHAAEPQTILGLTLDQSAPDPADPGGLKAAFGAEIAATIIGLMMVEQPTPQYQIELTGKRKLFIWFNDAEPDRPIYRITLMEPAHSGDMQKRRTEFGPSDLPREGFADSNLKTLLVKFDPALDAADRAAVARAYSRVPGAAPVSLGRGWRLGSDPRQPVSRPAARRIPAPGGHLHRDGTGGQ